MVRSTARARTRWVKWRAGITGDYRVFIWITSIHILELLPPLVSDPGKTRGGNNSNPSDPQNFPPAAGHENLIARSALYVRRQVKTTCAVCPSVRSAVRRSENNHFFRVAYEG